ncbi:hypothetical protein BDU57DRAFT_555555 [Ampelomyces quisqualis]|uniref:Uncharacterized protein n=1 Tax=Ampelomyces quisqualis TaxID=50730 RepID=A0A6A5QPX6_AMPQU|nr:hypothetical protein BDU57DRAFT_555555 [Ampelomyces quisqualis]
MTFMVRRCSLTIVLPSAYLFVRWDAASAVISRFNIKAVPLSFSSSTNTHSSLKSQQSLDIFRPICKSAFSHLARLFPNSWTAQHHIHITNILHVLLLVRLAPVATDFLKLVAATLVMVSSDMFQRALDWEAKAADKSDCPPHASSVAETPVTCTSSVHPGPLKSGTPISPRMNANEGQTVTDPETGAPESKSNVAGPKEEIVRLQGAITDLKTANKAKDVLLQRTREELKSAQETLNETFAEYCSVRDEMRNTTENTARDHQALIYRKDIELFALRKGNEQKEKYINERDTKLEDIFQQQKATVELKDAQLKVLKGRLTSLDSQTSPSSSHDYEDAMDGDHALEVRLLRVKKAAKRAQGAKSSPSDSTTVDAEKDATMASLREHLALARKAADEVVNQKAELSRAWDIVKKVQASLKEERKLHTQTKEQFQNLVVNQEEEEQRKQISPLVRLPTIAEDKDELEAMFDKAQEDNLRLNSELEMLEIRLREANNRMFNAEQEANTLREQMQVKDATSNDSEVARPSVVHHLHFQRMEAQIRESRDTLAAKLVEIELLKKTIAGKDDYVKDLQAEVDAAVSFHTEDQDEIERLKQAVTELQATKDQLRRDHERLSVQANHLRIPSVEHASARSSGPTLIPDLISPLTKPAVESVIVKALSSMPVSSDDVRNNSIQETPKRHIRSEDPPNRWHLMSNEVPPPELRGFRRRSLGLKDFVKKIVKKEPKIEDAMEPNQAKEEEATNLSNNRAALSTKDRDASILRATVASKLPDQDPFHTPQADPASQTIRATNIRRHTPRYYTAQDASNAERPQTAAAAEMTTSKDDTSVSTKRRSWSASQLTSPRNKLKRRSLY